MNRSSTAETIYDELAKPARQRKFYPIPTDDVIRSVLERYKKTERFTEEKEIIAFFKQNHRNDNMKDVMLKATALRGFMRRPGMYLNYATHYILSDKAFDRKLQRGVMSIVDAMTASSRARWKYCDFASKYCAFHQPELYLYSDWSLVLQNYDQLDHFMQGKRFSLSTSYSVYLKPFLIFREYYGLQKYSLSDLQHFLWQLRNEESAEYDRYCLDKDAQRISRNEVIVGMINGDR